jgi:hypothetical protein
MGAPTAKISVSAGSGHREHRVIGAPRDLFDAREAKILQRIVAADTDAMGAVLRIRLGLHCG